MDEIEFFLKKTYAYRAEILGIYNIHYDTFNKYVKESKVKIIKRGSKCFYKTSDVHLMLSERGYPKQKKAVIPATA